MKRVRMMAVLVFVVVCLVGLPLAITNALVFIVGGGVVCSIEAWMSGALILGVLVAHALLARTINEQERRDREELRDEDRRDGE